MTIFNLEPERVILRWSIVADDDGHHYFVPDNMVSEWYTWLDNWSYDPPSYAIRMDYAVSQYSFTDPQVRGRSAV